MYNLPRTYNNCNTTVDSSTYTKKLSSTISSCNACVENTDCCQVNADAIQEINNQLVIIDASINYLYSFDLSNIVITIEDISQNVYDNSQSIIELNNEVDDLSGVIQDLSATVQDLSASVYDLSGEIYSLPSVVADLSGVVADLSSVVLDLSGDFNTLNIAFTDLSGIVSDLSSVVLDLSGDFNTLNIVFIDLSGVVADLSSVVLDLSGDFNTLNTAFVDLSGVVADLSSVVLDLSGDFNTLNIAFTDLSGVVVDLSSVVLDLSGDFNTLSTAFTDLSGIVEDLSNSKVDRAGDTMTGDLVLNTKLVLSTDPNDVFITKTGTSNKSLLLQAGDNNSATNDNFAIQFNVRDANANIYNPLLIDGSNQNIIANRELIVYNQTYAVNGIRTFVNTGGSNTYPFIATGNKTGQALPKSANDIEYGFGLMYKTDGNMDILRYNGSTTGNTVMNFNRGTGDVTTEKNLSVGEGILFNSGTTPSSITNKLYRVGNDLYWDNDRLSVWDTSGTSLVLDPSYDNIIIPGSTTELGVNHTTNTAYLETDLSNIKFNVQGNNAITIDNSSIDLSGTVSFSDTLIANQGLKISTYTPVTSISTLYTTNGTDLYWNNSIIGSDISAVVHDLSAVVLDLSGDFNTLSTAFVELSGVVADLSSVVLDLSGDLNTLNTAFVDLSGVVADLSGVVADLSGVVLDLSGDFNTLNTAFTDLSGVVADLSNSKVDRAGDTMTGNLTISKSTPQLVLNDTTSSNNGYINVDSSGLMLNVNSSEVLKLSGPNATGTNPFIIVRNTFGNSSRMRYLNPGDVNDVFDIGIHNSTLGNERFIDHNGYQLGFYGSGTKGFNGGSVILNTDLSLNHGLTLNAATAPASTTNKLYRVDNDVYWDGQKLSVWDTSGTSLVIDLSYDSIIIPGSTTKLGVDSGNNKAYLETDLASIDLIQTDAQFKFNGESSGTIARLTSKPNTWNTGSEIILGDYSIYGREIAFTHSIGIEHKTTPGTTHRFNNNIDVSNSSAAAETYISIWQNSGYATLKSVSGYFRFRFRGVDFYQADGANFKFFQPVLNSNDQTQFTSDRRIKTNIQEINDGSAFQIVKKLEPKTYNYIDPRNGNETVYGFIAQEIREVFPPGVRLHRDVIPDILKNVTINGNIITFETDTELIVGNQVQIKKSSIENIGEELKVVNKIDSKTYTLDKQLEYTTGFCYGHYVDDFHYVIKNRLVPILWSATQQVIKEQDLLKLKVQTLEIEKNNLVNKAYTLEQDNTTLKQDNALLKQQVADIEARLKRIEESLQT